ncbi:helix-turn-helix domain-containing protein [Herbidospora sp. NEAU-GS84]|uniref:Helix-turn-helix domain-containing protein n=1 Tax=Herbidospora solisilvae TaxID=2696284 RepID=A0A7C9JCE8_9ACTN|nr:helix-turn-helix domain-containing protein [Herbidospora solisilvae]NAS23524.1 helix-turn-helix domain-containing protein [Herbidospora solisilvae]
MQTTLIRLDHLPAGERFDFWWEAVAQSVVSVDAASAQAADFWAEMTAVDLGLVQISRVRSAEFEARRTTRRIRQSDPEFYQLNYTVSGRSGLEQQGRQCSLSTGDFTLYDTSRPFHAWSVATPSQPPHGIVVQFPHRAIPLPTTTVERLLCRPIPGRTGVNGRLAGLLMRLAGPRPAPAPLTTTILELITVLLADHAGVAKPGDIPLIRVQAFVEDHLPDSGLSPASIAHAHHMSLRNLQRLFERQGLTAANWIRDRRLARARRDLADPRCDNLAVRSIGARWGFQNDAHFNRTFRAAYGVSPGAYRTGLRSTLTR